jgi:hypothetical protein
MRGDTTICTRHYYIVDEQANILAHNQTIAEALLIVGGTTGTHYWTQMPHARHLAASAQCPDCLAREKARCERWRACQQKRIDE